MKNNNLTNTNIETKSERWKIATWLQSLHTMVLLNLTMHSKIYSSVLVDKLLCHSYKTHNNRPALVLGLFRNLYIYRSIDKHLLALFPLSEIRSVGR
jgi:hypothetical protein